MLTRSPLFVAFCLAATLSWGLVGCANVDNGTERPATYLAEDGGSSSSGASSSSGSSTSSGSSSSGNSSSGGSSTSSSSSSGGPDPFPKGANIELVTNSAYLSRAQLLINTATSRLDIVQFEAKGSSITDILMDDLIKVHNDPKRKVIIRVLFDDEIDYNKSQLAKLKEAGITAKVDSLAIRTHCKLVYTDKAVLVGSTNWSTTSITKNNEANVMLRLSSARKTIGSYIDKLWDNSAKHHETKVGGSKIAAVYTDRGYEAVAKALIKKAKTSIEVVAYSMNHNPNFKDGPVQRAVAELKAAVKRGVKVRVLLDQSPWSEFNTNINKTAISQLKKMGIEARLDPEQQITHAKVLIVDDKFVVGTNNWGKGGFELYHEIGIRSEDKKVRDELRAYFDGIWKKSF